MSRADAPSGAESGPVRVRPVAAEDLPAVLAMKNRAWRTAYGHVLSEAALDEIDAGLPQQIQAWKASLVAPGVVTVMAEQTAAAGGAEARDPATTGPEHPASGPAEAGAVVGMACAGPRRDLGPAAAALAGTDLAEADLPELELFAIYLDERAYGTGLGDRLLAEVLGDAPALLWVLHGNGRAEAFYRRHGFEAVGRPVPLGGEWGGRAERLYVRR
jgi:GNAT superfamily N-acetyltransferase